MDKKRLLLIQQLKILGSLMSESNSAASETIVNAWSTIESLVNERDEARKGLFQMRDMLTAVHDGLENEGDRIYLGSSNHAQLIHEAWHFADSIMWDEFMERKGS